MFYLTPYEILQELNKYIIGQEEAKKAVAIALRNRWRRAQLPDNLKNEITPKNILLVGPTGVGKSEIAKRIANITCSPFIKVEATNFTEVGYIGKDVASIIRQLTEKTIQNIKDYIFNRIQTKAKKLAEKKLLNLILSNIKTKDNHKNKDLLELLNFIKSHIYSLKKDLKAGKLDNERIDIKIYDNLNSLQFRNLFKDKNNPLEFILSDYTTLLKSILNKNKNRFTTKKIKIKDVYKVLLEQAIAKIMNLDKIKKLAIQKIEQNGIVFIDEIDKICNKKFSINNTDFSGEGVQRDLLPLLEGCKISTKYGLVKTDQILFIAAGSFHSNKRSDLIPELQGRFPIQVKLNPLNKQDLANILTSTKSSLIFQYKALLKTEDYELIFTPDSINRIAEIAWGINEETENIGARRLHTVLEKLLENISFSTTKGNLETITIDKNYVNEQLSSLIPKENFSKFII